eukprot:6184482-Pleurochrysis_carterae.AAC.3
MQREATDESRADGTQEQRGAALTTRVARDRLRAHSFSERRSPQACDAPNNPQKAVCKQGSATLT